MNILSLAPCFNVEDVMSSSKFMIDHFGFVEEMKSEGFISLLHPQTGLKLVYHSIGLQLLPDYIKYKKQQGVILAIVVTEIELEEAKLRNKGITITTPLRTEPWGEKLFLLKDPNGVVIEVVEWNPQLQK